MSAYSTPTQTDCDHSRLTDGKIDVRHDLGFVYIDRNCKDCGADLTEGLQISHSQWYDRVGDATDVPAGATEVRG